MSYVPQDRKSWGSAQPLSLQENVIMTHHMTNTALQGRLRWMLSRRKTRQLANTIKEEFEVVVPNIDVPFFALSGGNQQRAIVGREFMLDNDLVILDQPTRGLDVASIEYIQERTLQKRADGQGILLISTDLDELFSLSDRILVMYRGQIVADLRPEETSPEKLVIHAAWSQRGRQRMRHRRVILFSLFGVVIAVTVGLLLLWALGYLRSGSARTYWSIVFSRGRRSFPP